VVVQRENRSSDRGGSVSGAGRERRAWRERRSMRLRPAPLLTCAVLLAFLASVAVATAAPPRPASPPSYAEFRKATRQFMRSPAPKRRSGKLRGGGLGTGSGNGGKGGLLSRKRLLTLYGAPQLSATILGKLGPTRAATKVVKQAKPYSKLSDRKIIPGFDLIAVVANSTPGPDRKYRTRQPNKLIRSYLRSVRSVNGRLVLDIQPGRARILSEIDALRKWIAQPDVDVSIDPEWNVGPHGVPGRTVGKIKAKELNKVSRRIEEIIDENDLPPKALVVHQFHSGSVRRRADVKQRKSVNVTLSFDGIGSPAAKRAGYKRLSGDAAFSGFSIFYSLDTRIMSPKSVLGLRPDVDFLLYQ
jgi:hypothetical protein